MNNVKETKDKARQLIKKAQDLTGSEQPSEELRDVSIMFFPKTAPPPCLTHSKDCQGKPTVPVIKK